MTKPRNYDQPLFPDMTPPGDDTKPRPQADIDRQIDAIAFAAAKRVVTRVEVTSEAAHDQGYVHETPSTGLQRPAPGQLQEADGLNLIPSNPSSTRLTDAEIARGSNALAAIREHFARPDRPKFPRI